MKRFMDIDYQKIMYIGLSYDGSNMERSYTSNINRTRKWLFLQL